MLAVHMGNRQEPLRPAFAAFDSGDVEPFREVLDPDAEPTVPATMSTDIRDTLSTSRIR